MNYIINPISGEKVNIISQSGRQILKNYINIYNNGGTLRAERTGDTTVRITSSSPTFSESAEDIYVPAKIEDEYDGYFDLDKIDNNLKQINDTMNELKQRTKKPFSDEPIDIRARSITPPNIDYVERYDNMNNKLNSHYQLYMDKAEMYLNNALERGLITEDNIKDREVLGKSREEIAKGVADKYFHDSYWLGKSAFEYYGTDYAWFHNPLVRKHSPPPTNITDFEEELSDLELPETDLSGGSKRKISELSDFSELAGEVKKPKRRGSFDIPFFRTPTELEAIEKEARDKGMRGDGILTSPVSEFIARGTLDEESKKMLDHLDKYLSRFTNTSSPLPILSPSPTLPPPPPTLPKPTPTLPKPTPRRSERLAIPPLPPSTGGYGEEDEERDRAIQDYHDIEDQQGYNRTFPVWDDFLTNINRFIHTMTGYNIRRVQGDNIESGNPLNTPSTNEVSDAQNT